MIFNLLLSHETHKLICGTPKKCSILFADLINKNRYNVFLKRVFIDLFFREKAKERDKETETLMIAEHHQLVAFHTPLIGD